MSKAGGSEMLGYLLSMVEHGKEEHGHQQQRRLLGPQEIPVGRRNAIGGVVIDECEGTSRSLGKLRTLREERVKRKRLFPECLRGDRGCSEGFH